MPATTISDGTWEVGVDVQPGEYKTTGTEFCYWARLRNNDGSRGDISDNNAGADPQTATTRQGEYFESHSCGDWTKVE